MSTFKVETKEDHGSYYLSVTHNGYQWNSIRLNNLQEEIPLIIIALAKMLKEEIHGEVTPPAARLSDV